MKKIKIVSLSVVCAFMMALLSSLTVSAANFDDISEKKSYYDTETQLTLPYRLFVPEDYDENKEYAILLYLHGSGERGNDNVIHVRKNTQILEFMTNEKNKSEYPAIIVAPQCPNDGWWGYTELEVVKKILDSIIEEYSISEDKHYIMGFSMGSFGTWDMLMMYPDFFDAAVPVSGGGDPDAAEIVKDIPIWAFHGAKDNIVTYHSTRAIVFALQDIGGRIYYTEEPNKGHEVFTTTPFINNSDLLRWLFSENHPIPPEIEEIASSEPLVSTSSEQSESIPNKSSEIVSSQNSVVLSSSTEVSSDESTDIGSFIGSSIGSSTNSSVDSLTGPSNLNIKNPDTSDYIDLTALIMIMLLATGAMFVRAKIK